MSKINCPDELWKFKPAWLSHAEPSIHSCLSAEYFAANRDAHSDSQGLTYFIVKAQHIYILNVYTLMSVNCYLNKMGHKTRKVTNGWQIGAPHIYTVSYLDIVIVLSYNLSKVF